MLTIEEEIKSARLKIEEIKAILKKKSRSTKDFTTLKASFYQLIVLETTIKEKVYQKKDNSLNAIVNNPIFTEVVQYYTQNIDKMVLKEISEDLETYYNIFEEELVPLLQNLERMLEELEKELTPSQITVIYNDEYKKAMKGGVCLANKGTIKKKEQEIIVYWTTHEKGRQSSVALGNRDDPQSFHAHLPSPIDDYRIEYRHEKELKKLTFLRFGRARDLGYSGH